MQADQGDLWVFGYGSLMWRPGFDYVERVLATLHGFHRALCVLSHVHRGTPERPGLVLGLDKGGSCRGVAFRVEAAGRDATIEYLRAREQVTMVYRETWHDLRLADGRRVRGVAYTVDRAHRQYRRRLPQPDLLEHVRDSVGVSGPNPDYVRNTHAHLLELGIRDATLEWLSENV
ncbi:gamma-glutamylcyclotransferase [Alsobacter sp. SYSU M60028]|uniref:glutathione-specific gamma-glutamylcyclotransferase n=1 Tax=Alsobacter ponti TaxID=2962936 RepID=A0ABT1LDA4_9HYPH|nr:gamma-glutamylcyclotransferase [Alsobacter ponti]MCP8938705.1 gamma-glutamylcyclotransferase [Alsobacter ponti]